MLLLGCEDQVTGSPQYNQFEDGEKLRELESIV